jgi:Ca2+-binding RTX toxin-like protein
MANPVITTIVTTSSTSRYLVSESESVYFTKGITISDVHLSAISGTTGTTHDMNIVMEGTAISHASAVYLSGDGRFDSNNTFKLGAHGTLIGQNGVSVSSTAVHEVVINGQVLAEEFGIKSLGSDSTFAIGVTGQISASLAGIRSEGDNVGISNAGYVYGLNNGVYALNSIGFDLVNTGEFSGGSGVRLESITGPVSIMNAGVMTGNLLSGLYLDNTDATVSNTGVISGVGNGIYLTGTGTHVVHIVNSGSISGANAAILSDSPGFLIENSGVLNGDIRGGGSVDSLINPGVVQGDVTLGSGNDIYRGSGSGIVSGAVSGGGGNDVLKGGRFTDDLLGEAGNDNLRGHAGDDTLSGGDGKDILRGGRDDDTLSGDAGNDVLKGGAGDDELNGGSQKDKLYGGRGEDILRGGSGNDILAGLADDDTLIGGTGKDSFVFYAGNGHDTVTDFEDNTDTVVLDQTIWGGGLSVSQVLSNYASVVSGDTVFDFGGGDVLVVEGMAVINFLADDIFLI